MIINRAATYAVNTNHYDRKPDVQAPVDTFISAQAAEPIPKRSDMLKLSKELTPTRQDELGVKHYRPGAPNRYWLHPLGEPGERFWMPGAVKGTDGQPVPDAKVEFWVTNDEGKYSEEGSWDGRGWQKTDESGSYQLHCVRPGAIEEKMPPVVNVRVSAPDHETLNTRLFFEDDIYNRFDPGFTKERELELGSLHWGKTKYFTAEFDFVLREKAEEA